jgi:hypothetical protein
MNVTWRVGIPKCTLGADREILKNEPETSLALWILEAACVDGIHPYEIPRMVLVWGWSWYRHRHGSGRTLSIAIWSAVLCIAGIARRTIAILWH